jgi:uncharacterized protein DUF1707
MVSEPLPDASQMRAADTDRDRAAGLLRTAAAEGRITFGELDERVSQAYAAKTFADLQAITRDLPGPGVTPPAPAARAAASPAVTAGEAGPAASVAIMSGARRSGPWVVPAAYHAVAIMGAVELDLRQATFAAAEVTIRAFCLMGGITITVPEQVAVDVAGLGVMGGFDHPASAPGAPGAPTVRVAGCACMGGVAIRRRPARDELPG